MKSEVRTVGFKRGERNVFLHILTACNLQCRHCYINKQQHGSEALDLETINKWLHLFHDPEKKSNLVFLGGEPTMHRDLAASIDIAKELDYTVTVDTNGYLFYDLLEKSSPEKIDYLSFSLDGPDSEVNDPIRGKGVFETCTDNLRKALTMGYKVGVIYTVSRKNLHHLARMIPLLSDIGVKRFFIQVIGLRGNTAVDRQEPAGEAPEAWQVSREDWLTVVPKVAKKGAEAGIHVTYPKVYLDDGEEFECAGKVAENYFVFPNGRVYQCPLCEDYALHTYTIENDILVPNPGLTEKMLFSLNIDEGCVMNKLLQPDTIEYSDGGRPLHRISCCLLKNEIF